MTDLMLFPISMQIQEVQREIAMRERVYPAWVGKGKMKQSTADQHMNLMRAVLRTLEQVKADDDAGPPQ